MKRLMCRYLQVVLAGNTARGAVFGHVAVLQVDLGLSDEVVLADDVIIHDADRQVLLLGQRTAELHETESRTSRGELR